MRKLISAFVVLVATITIMPSVANATAVVWLNGNVWLHSATRPDSKTIYLFHWLDQSSSAMDTAASNAAIVWRASDAKPYWDSGHVNDSSVTVGDDAVFASWAGLTTIPPSGVGKSSSQGGTPTQVTFNIGITENTNGSGTTGASQRQMVACHEFGHVLGLNHDNGDGGCMRSYYAEDNGNGNPVLVWPSTSELNTVSYMYDITPNGS